EMADWEMGAIWRIEREPERESSDPPRPDTNGDAGGQEIRAPAIELRCVEVWHLSSLPMPEFERITRQSTFAPGIGLPGRVWSSGQPAWIPDVTQDSNFPRAAVARKDGLRAGFCFPIGLSDEVLGVLECFSRQVREPDEDFLQMLENIGSQVGQFIERVQAEEAHFELVRRERAARSSTEKAKAETEKQVGERRQIEEALGRWASQPLPQETRPALWRYGVAIVSVVCAILVRLVFDPILENQLALVTLYGAVAFAVWWGGRGPAVFTCVSGYLAASWLFMEPRFSWRLGPQDVTGLSLYLISSAVVIAVGEAMRRAQRHAHSSAGLAVVRQREVEAEMLAREKVQEELRDREAQLRVITDITPLMLARCDRDLRYKFVNRAYAEMLGLHPDQIIGQPIAEIMGVEGFETIRPRVELVLQGQSVEYEEEMAFTRLGPRFLRSIYVP